MADGDVLTRTGRHHRARSPTWPPSRPRAAARPARRMSTRSASCCTRACRASTRSAPATPRRPRAASGCALPALQRVRRDLPAGLCRAIDAAVVPDPEQRAGLGALRVALSHAVDRVADEVGPIARTRASRGPPGCEPAAAGSGRRRRTSASRATARMRAGRGGVGPQATDEGVARTARMRAGRGGVGPQATDEGVARTARIPTGDEVSAERAREPRRRSSAAQRARRTRRESASPTTPRPAFARPGVRAPELEDAPPSASGGCGADDGAVAGVRASTQTDERGRSAARRTPSRRLAARRHAGTCAPPLPSPRRDWRRGARVARAVPTGRPGGGVARGRSRSCCCCRALAGWRCVAGLALVARRHGAGHRADRSCSPPDRCPLLLARRPGRVVAARGRAAARRRGPRRCVARDRGAGRALARRARRSARSACLWLVLVEALTSERLLFGQPRDVLAARRLGRFGGRRGP